VNGKYIVCINCSGSGLVLSMCGEPDECRECGGSGKNWQYPGGAIARYYSGPFIGRDAKAIEAQRAETTQIGSVHESAAPKGFARKGQS
jgi:hypothetical protein